MEQLEAYHHYCQTLFNLGDLICHFPSSNTPSLHLHIPLGSLAQRLFPPPENPRKFKDTTRLVKSGRRQRHIGPLGLLVAWRWACYDPGPAPLRPRRPPPSAARPTPPRQSGRAAFQQRTLSSTLLQAEEQSGVECAGPVDLPPATRGGGAPLLLHTRRPLLPSTPSLLLLLLLLLVLRTSFTLTCLRF